VSNGVPKSLVEGEWNAK